MGAQENVKFGDCFPKEGGFELRLKGGQDKQGKREVGDV